jgi:hypothetical protein
MNVATDYNGNLKFYTVQNKGFFEIYNSSNVAVYNTLLTGEISHKTHIIEVGCNRYHIIVGNNILQYDLATNEINVLFSFPSLQVITGSNNQKINLMGVFSIRLDIGSNGKAKGYYLHALTGNADGGGPESPVRTRTYYVNGTTNIVTQTQTITFANHSLLHNTFRGATFYVSEMAISPDGSKLAVAGSNNLAIFNRDVSNGNLSYNNFYEYNTDGYYKVAGLEFANNNKLIFSKFDYRETYPNNSSSERVEVLDISTSTITSTVISNSHNFARSHIEMGKNGKIYVCSSNGLYWIDWNKTNPSIETAITNFSPELTEGEFGDPSTTDGNNFRLFALPGQSSGQVNDYSDQFPTTTYTTLTFPTGTHTYSNGSGNSFLPNNGIIHINQKLKVPNGANITINQRHITFGSFAELEIEKGGKLTLNNCLLEAGGCQSNMWNGIVMNSHLGSTNNNNFAELVLNDMVINQLSYKTVIRDAYKAIEAKSNNCKITFNGVRFEANAQGLVAKDLNAKEFNFLSAEFIGNEPLKTLGTGKYYYEPDPIPGQPKKWEMSLTNNHIELNNVWNFKLGHLLASRSPEPIKFVGAEVAILLYRSSAEIYGADFTGFRRFALNAEAGVKNIHEFKMEDCKIAVAHPSFYDFELHKNILPRGVRVAHNYRKVDLNSCEFADLPTFAFDCSDNKGAKINIGTTLGNTFNNIGWAAINMQSNRFFIDRTNQGLDNIGTEITIRNNIITNHHSGNGILITESGLQSTPSYHTLQINANQINSLSKGIKLVNIKGNNDVRPLEVSLPFGNRPTNPFNTRDDKFMISNNLLNIIKYEQSGLFENFGIAAYSSPQINIDNNAISGVTGFNYIYGISSQNSPQIHVNRNTFLSNNAAMFMSGSMLNSNYTCNTVNQSGTGYLLFVHELRPRLIGNTQFKVHGWNDLWNITPRGEGYRVDMINKTPSGHNIVLNQSHSLNNLWSFTQNIYTGNFSALNFSINYINPPSNNKIIIGYSRNRCEVSNTVINGNDLVLPNPPANSYDVSNPANLWSALAYASEKGDEIPEEFSSMASEISTLSAVQDLLFLQQYDSALFILNQMQASNPIAQDYKTIWQAIAQTRLQDQIVQTDSGLSLVHSKAMDSTLLDQLTHIAQKNAVTESPAAVSARAVLWMETQDWIFNTQEIDLDLGYKIRGYVDSQCLIPNQAYQWNTWLCFENGDFAGIEGQADSSGIFEYDWNEIKAMYPHAEGMNFKIALSHQYGDTFYSALLPYESLFQSEYVQIGCFNPNAVQQSLSLNKNQEKDQTTYTLQNNQLQIHSLSYPVELKIFDISGRLLVQKSITEKNEQISMDYSPGIYILQITNPRNHESQSFKLYKQ